MDLWRYLAHSAGDADQQHPDVGCAKRFDVAEHPAAGEFPAEVVERQTVAVKEVLDHVSPVEERDCAVDFAAFEGHGSSPSSSPARSRNVASLIPRRSIAARTARSHNVRISWAR